jgi:hypothetical protein
MNVLFLFEKFSCHSCVAPRSLRLTVRKHFPPFPWSSRDLWRTNDKETLKSQRLAVNGRARVPEASSTGNPCSCLHIASLKRHQQNVLQTLHDKSYLLQFSAPYWQLVISRAHAPASVINHIMSNKKWKSAIIQKPFSFQLLYAADGKASSESMWHNFFRTFTPHTFCLLH